MHCTCNFFITKSEKNLNLQKTELDKHITVIKLSIYEVGAVIEKIAVVNNELTKIARTVRDQTQMYDIFVNEASKVNSNSEEIEDAITQQKFDI